MSIVKETVCFGKNSFIRSLYTTKCHAHRTLPLHVDSFVKTEINLFAKVVYGPAAVIY